MEKMTPKLLSGVKTLLFDFDNTLLVLDEDIFVKKYAMILSNRFNDYFTTEEFVHHLLSGTRHMVEDRTAKPNHEKFLDYFVPKCNGVGRAEIYERFLEFYSGPFAKVGDETHPHPLTRELLELASEKGLEVVIATNPLFPEVAAVARLQWAGIRDLWPGTIRYITHAENSSFAKPQGEYFTEMLQNLGRTPEECLMVGNDYYNDGAASLVGVKFFHVVGEEHDMTSFLDDSSKDMLGGREIHVTQQGSLESLLALLEDL